MTTGVITSVKGDRLMIKGTRGRSATSTTSSIAVSLSSSTTYIRTISVSSSSVSVGDCVTATSSGSARTSFTARRVEITGTRACTTMAAGGAGASNA